jgi:hypothetical protein
MQLKKNYFMKKQVSLLSVLAICITMGFVACKKESSTNNNTGSADVSKHSDDQARFSGAVDGVSNDADIALESSTNFTGRGQQVETICDATVAVDTVSNPRTITITYNGTSCWGAYTRAGVVVISMAQGVHWKDAGAIVDVNYHNLIVTRLSDNKSITINGTMTHTNVSGGLLYQLATVQTITHTVTSTGMSVTFDDNSQRNWQVAKQRVFTYDNGIVITSTGTHTDGNNSNIAEWGTNRFGHAFTSSISAPLVIRQDCNFRIVSGQVTHQTENVTAVATFGLDSSGNATSCPGSGVYYFKLVWTGPAGIPITLILPY